MSTPLDKAIAAAGGQVALAQRIGVSQQRVSWWVRRSRGRVPAEFAKPIEQATNGRVTASALRPDVFGEQPTERTAA